MFILISKQIFESVRLLNIKISLEVSFSVAYSYNPYFYLKEKKPNLKRD